MPSWRKILKYNKILQTSSKPQVHLLPCGPLNVLAFVFPFSARLHRITILKSAFLACHCCFSCPTSFNLVILTPSPHFKRQTDDMSLTPRRFTAPQLTVATCNESNRVHHTWLAASSQPEFPLTSVLLLLLLSPGLGNICGIQHKWTNQQNDKSNNDRNNEWLVWAIMMLLLSCSLCWSGMSDVVFHFCQFLSPIFKFMGFKILSYTFFTIKGI